MRSVSHDREFSVELFREPPAHLWPGYFWVLNDRIDEERLLEQLRDMRSHGARSVCLLSEPPAFRPGTLATEMDRPYLGRAYMATVRRVVAECERLGMSYWLYDEGGWPSGGACGQVYARNPIAHARKVVRYVESHIGPDERLTVPEDVICMAVEVDGRWQVHKPGAVVEARPDDAKLRTFFLVDVSARGDGAAPYVDVLCPEAVRTFLDLTHQRHREHVGTSFGRSILFTFTDEPAAVHTACASAPEQLTWTSDMADEFQRRKGYDVVPWLPWLLSRPADGEDVDITRARIDFFDTWSQLFVERHLEPIRAWCRDNGLLSAGHFGGEDEPRYNADGGYGHILRGLRGLDVPGVDAIWRQLFPGLRSHQFPKYASSVARQKAQPYVLTESFGVYGNGLTPAQMKWITDQQYVRGTSLMVVACYPYSTRDHFMPGERPHFGPANPLWKYMDLYHAYTARLGYLLTRGPAVCRTAVYYDVRSIWAGASTREESLRQHDELAARLLQAQCDFDYIDDDVLAGEGSRIEDGKLVVGPMRYDTVVVPVTRWMTTDALRGLADLAQAGGNVVAIDELPAAQGGQIRLGDNLGRGRAPIRVAMDEVVSHVEPLVRLDPSCGDVRVCQHAWDGKSLYFFTNEGQRTVLVRAVFDEHAGATLCDPESGKLLALAAERTAEGSSLDLEVPPWGSMAVLFGAEPEDALRPFVVDEELPLAEGWALRPLRRHLVGERDFEVIDLDGAEWRPVSLGDWRCSLGAGFSGEAQYSVLFRCNPEQAARPARLELGDVRYACEVELNGEAVGRRIWLPFALGLDGKLRTGANELCVRVTNTLANALLDPEAEHRWRAMGKGRWPANGLSYDPQARRFECDSLSAGLFGPVRIAFGTRA